MNAPQSNIFLALQTQLIAKIPAIVYIDMDYGQFERPERPNVSFPCVLIDFQGWVFTDLSDLVQMSEGNIIIKVADDPYSSSASIVPEEYKEAAINFLELEAAVYQAFQGFKPSIGASNARPMGRTACVTDNRRPGMKVKVMTFSCSYTDYAAKTAITYVPATLYLSASLITAPAIPVFGDSGITVIPSLTQSSECCFNWMGDLAEAPSVPHPHDAYRNTTTGITYYYNGTDWDIIAQGGGGSGSGTWRDGTGAPDDTLGSDGDYYLDDTTGNIYHRATGTYAIVANITGPQGTQGDKGDTGDKGDKGDTGDAGEQGIQGTPGSQWYQGSGVPSSGTGIDGDDYLNTANGDTYQKATGTWSLTGNIKGATGGAGGAGAPGSQWYQGSGVPSSGTGINGDDYLNTANGDTYQKATGAWSLTGNIKGATGSTGGAGAPGSQWYVGSGVPSSGTGINGDDYLNTANGDTYQKATGAWSLTGNIKGATGGAGGAGAPGSQWYQGSGVPSSGTGINGDDYLNTANGDTYQKATGAWSLTGNIKGATGGTGAPGASGIAATTIVKVSISGGNYIPDFSLGNIFILLMTANGTLAMPANITSAGQTGLIYPKQDVTGSRTLAYAGCYQFNGGAVPALNVTKLGKDLIAWACDSYNTGTVTITAATPGIMTWTAHGLDSGDRLYLTTTGTLLTGLTAGTWYWVTVVDANTLKLSTSQANAGAATFIATSGTQSGTHTAIACAISLGYDGSFS